MVEISQPKVTVTESGNTISIKYNGADVICTGTESNCLGGDNYSSEGEKDDDETWEIDWGEIFGPGGLTGPISPNSTITIGIDDFGAPSNSSSPSDEEGSSSQAQDEDNQPDDNENKDDPQTTSDMDCAPDDTFCIFLSSLFNSSTQNGEDKNNEIEESKNDSKPEKPEVDKNDSNPENSEESKNDSKPEKSEERKKDSKPEEGKSNSKSEKPKKPEEGKKDSPSEEVDNEITPLPWNPFTSIITTNEEKDNVDLVPESKLLMSHSLYKHLVERYRKRKTPSKSKPYKIRFSIKASKQLLHQQYLKMKSYTSHKLLQNKLHKVIKMKVKLHLVKDSKHLPPVAKRFRSAVLLMEVYKSKENRARFMKYAQLTKFRFEKIMSQKSRN